MIEHYESEQKPPVASFYVYNYNEIQIGQGADGFFMEYQLLGQFAKYYEEIKDQDYIFYHDDFFISYYFHLLQIPIYFMHPPNKNIYDVSAASDIDALHNLQNKYSRPNLNIKSYEILRGLQLHRIIL